MKNDLDGLGDLEIVYLAIGEICCIRPEVSPERALELTRSKVIRHAAKEIVLESLCAIANEQDKDMDFHLRKAVCAYAYFQINGRKRGRPDDWSQRAAIMDAYNLLTLYSGKREWKHDAVIAELCARFKLSRAQVEKVLQRIRSDAEKL